MEQGRMQKAGGGVGYGVMLCLLLHLIGQAAIGGILYLIAEDIAILSVPTIGLSQLIYVLPCVIWLRKSDRVQVAKGVGIGAALTFLLNAACVGVVMHSFSNGMH